MYMANISVGSSSPGTADPINPFVLAGIVLPWIALNGFLKPHSERISFAEHRFRIFLQFCTFVTVLSVATMMRRNKSRH
ncbi:Uncharacterized protein BM_BM7842 [Brugia malayi]|uniref:Uncharacterized protein n=1 Tax=Brugia malayi TaxID=6279 RepID=A0A4E9FD49_BRUMA|nr:Uncharacterized protein BM_BM7842 [Brugia malayi]VIO94717.1 Uncharacterized protein BM_BM7842 [Brugia malayi]